MRVLIAGTETAAQNFLRTGGGLVTETGAFRAHGNVESVTSWAGAYAEF